MDDLVERGANKSLVICHHCDGQDGSGMILQVTDFGDTNVFSAAQSVSDLSDWFPLFFEASRTRNPKSQSKKSDPARFIGSRKKHGPMPGVLRPVQRSREHHRP